MDHLQIPTEADDDASWKQKCNERMEELKNTQFPRGDAASQPGLLHKELAGAKELLMISEFYEAVENGNVDDSIKT